MEDTKTRIYVCLTEGMSKKDAALVSGISESTLYRWFEEDESFKSQVEASILEYKRRLINNVTTCAEKDGRLALEVLKRKFPNEWGDNAYTLINTHALEREGVVAVLNKVYAEEYD